MPMVCYNSTEDASTSNSIFDKMVIESIGIKIWHLVFMIFACGAIVTVVLCCIFRCRVPRTRQEIEANIERNRVTNQFLEHLKKLPYEGLRLIDVLDEVKELEKIRLKSGIEEKSFTLMQRFKLWLYSSRKEATIESLEKQASIEMVKKLNDSQSFEKQPSTELKKKQSLISQSCSIKS